MNMGDTKQSMFCVECLGIRKLPPLGKCGWGMLILLLLFAGFLRGWRLSEPFENAGDERYYIEAACSYWRGTKDLNTEHPPLGKIMIADGIRSCMWLRSKGFDVNNALCARVVPLSFGMGIVLLPFLLGYRVSGGSLTVAELATFLVATDFMSITFSRQAVLDPILSFWVLLGCFCGWLYLESKDRGRGSFVLALACAASFAIAFSTKWIGLVCATVTWFFMVFSSGVGSANFADDDNSTDGIMDTSLPSTSAEASQNMALSKTSLKNVIISAGVLFCLFFTVIASIYIVSYTPQFLREGFTVSTVSSIFSEYMRFVTWRYGSMDTSVASPFWLWPLGIRPLFSNVHYTARYGYVLFHGGSIIFWWPGFLFTIKYFITGIKQKRFNWVFITSIWLANWLIWILATGGGFIHYMLPGIPFMAIVMAWVIEKWAHERRRKLIGFYFLMLSTALAIYYPTLTFLPIRIDLCPILFPSWFINLLALLRAVLYG